MQLRRAGLQDLVMGLTLYPAFENISDLFLPENTATEKPLALSNLAFGITELTIPKVLALTPDLLKL